MTDTWNGTISKEMFDLSSVESNYQTFITQTRKYLINCLIGSAHLTGEGSLLEYFEDILEEVIERGEIALIEVGKEKLLATPKIIKKNLAKQELELEFTLLDNPDEKFTNKEISKWVIFKFNNQGTSPLLGLDFWTKRLVNILNRMEKEMFMNEKRLLFFSGESPDETDVAKWLKSFTKGIITVFGFDKSANPDKEAISKGKQGVNPNLVKFQIYEPKEFQEEKYRKQFAFVWTNMEQTYGIRHDSLQEKDERASVSEVFSSQANFDAFEKKVYRLLWKTIRDYNRIFEEGKSNYQFKFGRIGN